MKTLVSPLIKMETASIPLLSTFVFKENLSVIFGPILSLVFINYPKSVHISVISYITGNLNSNFCCSRT